MTGRIEMVGSLISFRHDYDNHAFGLVLGSDYYVGSMGSEHMLHILWSTGKLGWILSSRVEIL